MAVQYSVAARNAQIDAIETAIGTAPTLEIRSGAQPANCAAAASGTVLATLVLPSDWIGAASAGVKSLLGVWSDASADATGTAAHYRINQGATCHMQGSVTATGGGGDITLQTVSITATQPISITAFTLTAGGA